VEDKLEDGASSITEFFIVELMFLEIKTMG
jgi:hypothetical protein